MARSFIQKLRGLLFRKQIVQGEGLFLEPCNSIHMFGMKYSIDAIFLDRRGKVVALLRNFSPGKVSALYWSAHACLELPAGAIDKSGTELDDELVIED
jgi:uncharacterized membrane protein (UPF0127 family)